MEGTIGGVSNVSLPSHADARVPLHGIEFERSPSVKRRGVKHPDAASPDVARRTRLCTVPGASQQKSGSRARPTQEMEGGE
jgi:hypothetical protein